MKLPSSLLLPASLLLLCGCADFSPAISKTEIGNLEINVMVPAGVDPQSVRVYIDDLFIGNVSSRMPVLHLKRGKRIITVEVEGMETCTEAITILGDPNHQVLNVSLKKKAIQQ